MKRIALIILLFTVCIAAPRAQENTIIDQVVNNINKQLSVSPQEKIYLHTDKPYYISGEKLFFRAFLLNAFTNREDTLSRYVYVELINSADSLTQRVKIRPDENQLFHGAIFLPEELPQGIYTIRAYTQHMRNQDESSFFSKPVRIGDPRILQAETRNDFPSGENGEKNTVDFDVSFYPEGGQLIAGQLSNVAFKALDSEGTALDITGEIRDSRGNIVAEFKTVHEGMGDFFINPLPDKHYRAICRHGGQMLEFDLPPAQADALALKAVIRNEKLRITVNQSGSASLRELYLLIHSRGSVVYAGAWDAEKNYLAFDTSVFPSGVNHILLFTKNFQIVSERLVFLLNNDQGLASFGTQKEMYGEREQVRVGIQLKDENRQPLKGNFSIAVTSDKEVIPDTISGILSEILLNSELKGRIRNPDYYFQKGNEEAEQAADLLMRTHGWTRYDMPEIMKGNIKHPNVPFETDQRLFGTVKGGGLSKPAKDAKVSILSMNNNYVDQTGSDKNGRYMFRNLDFPDSTMYVIQALNSKGKGGRRMELYIDEAIFPGISVGHSGRGMREEKEKNDSIFSDYVAKADRHYTYEHGARVIDLPEVQVRGVRKEKKYKSVYYADPDFFLSEEKIKESGVINVKDLFYRIPGVWVIGNSIRIRGISSLNGGAPLILLDGVPINPMGGDDESTADLLRMINIHDIGQLDVIKDGASLTIFGSRGMGGVINIHTKRGEAFTALQPDNIKPVMPLGYQLPVEFYSPQYDTSESISDPKPDLRTTIYWKPDALTDNEGNAQLNFYTADDPGAYSVIIEGVSEDGKLIHYYGKSVITVE